MSNSEFLSSIKIVGKIAFLAITIILTFAYSVALIEKIERPTFKNLPINEFVIIGIILLILIFINLKWTFGFFKTKPNEK